jgi:hypothetical protein
VIHEFSAVPTVPFVKSEKGSLCPGDRLKRFDGEISVKDAM